jgi:menaquinone-dependent protoporphyrinogen oxidase
VSAASKYGATAEIAQAIGDVLAERGHTARVVPPEEVRSIQDYDAVVLGSAVYVGHWLTAAKDLVHRSSAEIAALPVWIFSSGPVGDPPKPEEDPVDVADLLSATKALGHRVFAGRIEKKRLSFGEKAMVMALRVPEGDFRDWTDIKGWAAEIADALSPQVGSTG